jgi:hypothetical protein
MEWLGLRRTSNPDDLTKNSQKLKEYHVLTKVPPMTACLTRFLVLGRGAAGAAGLPGTARPSIMAHATPLAIRPPARPPARQPHPTSPARPLARRIPSSAPTRLT